MTEMFLMGKDETFVERRKTALKKNPLSCFGQRLLTWTSLKKPFYGSFELPLLRNAQKRH
jgi:hypothetical protein